MLSVASKLKVVIVEIPLLIGATKPLCLKLSLTRVKDLKPILRGCEELIYG